MKTVLAKKLKAQKAAYAELDTLTSRATGARRAMTAHESRRFDALLKTIETTSGEIDLVRQAITSAEAVAEALRLQVRVRREPMTYDQGSQAGFFRDLAANQIPRLGLDGEAARRRLDQHKHEVQIEARTNRPLAQMIAASVRDNGGLEGRATNTADTYGGDFVPPLYLIDQVVPAFRPGRVIANRVRNMPLPPGTDQISLPKIAVGTTGYAQGASTFGTNAPLTSTDLTTSMVTAPVCTYYGQLEASLQLLEQSPQSASIDQVIWADLQAAYDQKLDADLLFGSGTSGAHKGVLTFAAANPSSSITYTSATATTAFAAKGGVFTSLVSAVNSIETNRYASPSALWLHPRRTGSISVQLASDGRPYYVKAGNGPLNALGTSPDANIPQGVAGELYGLDVVKVSSIPTTWNSTGSAVSTTGGTQDVLCAVREDDLILFESAPVLRALGEVSSGTLGVRFQLFAYSAFMVDRSPYSINCVTGPVLNSAQMGF